MLSEFLLGLVLSFAVAVAARRLGALTTGGTVTAIGVGTLIFGSGGWRWAALLVLFFATSSILTRWQAGTKPHQEHRRGRSGNQVLANGAVATALALLHGITPSALIASAFAGVIAASTADTWATEIGLLSITPPRLITTWQIVARGHSGGVTWLGTFGGAAGAAVIAAAASVWLDTPMLLVWFAGNVAMTVDSVLGATLEGRWRWMTNDTVNLLATGVGALIAVAVSGG